MKYLSFFLILALGFLLGCDHVPSKPTAPSDFERAIQSARPGTKITLESEEDIGESLYKHEGSASGEGAGVKTESEKVASSHDASSPWAKLFNGSGAEGGSTSIVQTLTGGSQESFLAWAAIIIGLGGIPVMIWVNRRAGFAMFGFAGVLLTASMLPQWVWVIVALGAVGAVGIYLWSEWGNKTKDVTLGTVLEGVEKADEPTRKAIKANVASVASKQSINVGKVIAKTKAKKNLPSERP